MVRILKKKISYGKMDADQSPIYVFIPGLVSVDEILSVDGFSKNEESFNFRC